MEITRRYRVGVSTSVKGGKSYDCTVEVTEGTNETTDLVSIQQVLLPESDALVAELDKRYPPPIDPASVMKPVEK